MTKSRVGVTVFVTALVFGMLVLKMLVFAAATRAQSTPTPLPRFDEIVRADFFAGFRGDAARLERGMKLCEDELATNPTNADALVWHGGGLMFLAGQAARQQDFATASERARRGRAEIDRADQLAPDSLSVMLVRAVVLNASAPNMRDQAQGRMMQQAAVAGFEKALAIQTPYLDRLPEHSRGELLAGLAEGWSRLGETERARGYLERIVTELPNTRYQARARAWLEDGPQSGPLTCLTCHRQ
jgi:tetratricopeptide (TPR) repeat protein